MLRMEIDKWSALLKLQQKTRDINQKTFKVLKAEMRKVRGYIEGVIASKISNS